MQGGYDTTHGRRYTFTGTLPSTPPQSFLNVEGPGGAPSYVISEFEQLLQFHVATYMDNDIAGIPQASCQSYSCSTEEKGSLRPFESYESDVPWASNVTHLQERVRNVLTTCVSARRSDAFLQYSWIVERHLKGGEFCSIFCLLFTPGLAVVQLNFAYALFGRPESEEVRAEFGQVALVRRQTETARSIIERSVETVLNKARDRSGQHAQKHLKEDNDVKQMRDPQSPVMSSSDTVTMTISTLMNLVNHTDEHNHVTEDRVRKLLKRFHVPIMPAYAETTSTPGTALRSPVHSAPPELCRATSTPLRRWNMGGVGKNWPTPVAT
ncbi:hypothetical protein NMY22_g8353 [Coprinellus aureogranulatus]|nr:hypothetical protein NMY22_g8353 [Coprinellus aureogranulatus]